LLVKPRFVSETELGTRLVAWSHNNKNFELQF